MKIRGHRKRAKSIRGGGGGGGGGEGATMVMSVKSFGKFRVSRLSEMAFLGSSFALWLSPIRFCHYDFVSYL